MMTTLRRLARGCGPLPALALLSALLVNPAGAQGFLCLEGGGDAAEGDWDDGVVQWVLDRAGPDADVLVLSLGSPATALVQAFAAAGVPDAAPLVVTPAIADELLTFNTILLADVVWIADEPLPALRAAWDGTLTQLALQNHYDEGGVLAGSGGGAALLGGVLEDASNGLLDPRDGLADPFHPSLDFAAPFVDVLPGALVDTGFTLRGGMGSLPVLLARANAELAGETWGLGVDRRTALCIDPDLTAEVRGEGSVTLLHELPGTRVNLAPGVPLSYTDLRYLQLVEGYVVDLATRTVLDRPASAILHGPPLSDPIFSMLDVPGDSSDANKLGDVRPIFPLGSDSLFLGAMQLADGSNQLLRTVVSPFTWAFPNVREITVGGTQWALSLSPHFLALFLDDGVRAFTSTADTLLVRTQFGKPPRSAVVLDSFGVASTAVSTHVADPALSVGPRQSSAIDDARLHVLAPLDGYDARGHAALLPDDAWVDLGQGLGGALGAPELSGTGVIIDFNTVTATLSNAAPNSVGFLILGASAIEQPFKLGTLVPAPDLISGALPTGPLGQLELDFLWPAGVPRGFQVYAQFWIVDPTAGVGFAASNGLLIQAP